jgi:LmbE family N-acetylglucosaminyl deacetylase
MNASEIKLSLKKLNVLGSVLYIGAHPDDENTAFLTYCSSEKLLRTGYLSLTRGDGGQNLIGDEQAELLGVIRTEELLQARRIDGAEQFFTRAIDFGYTKSPEETFKFWDKEKILSDVVWVIRKFKPDVIVTRFPITGEGRHGQHTASAILALEAFRLAGDQGAFPEQLEYVNPWQPKRIYWNGWTPAFDQMGISADTLISLNLGTYNPLLGKSYTEISEESRSMHKSQGFGFEAWRGNRFNYFLFMDGDEAVNNLFDDIETSWDRIDGTEDIKIVLNSAEKYFDEENPALNIPKLLRAYNLMNKRDEDYWLKIKKQELVDLIKSCAGFWVEAIVDEKVYAPGDKVKISTAIVNRSGLNFLLEGVHITYQSIDSLLNEQLEKGEIISLDKEIQIPENIQITQPHWLAEKNSGDIFTIENQLMRDLPVSAPPLMAHFRVSLDGKKFVFTTPVLCRERVPTKGEVYYPVSIAPPITVNFESSLYLFPSNEKREVRLIIKNLIANSNGELTLNAQDGWKIEPAEFDFKLVMKNEEKQFIINVTPPAGIDEAVLEAVLTVDNKTYRNSFVTIDYAHIPLQTVFPQAKAKLVRLNDVQKIVNKIGYIEGSGDKIPNYLKELGFEVDYLTDEDLSNGKLSNFDVIIAGIRTYNTNKRINIYQDKLMEYVHNGGTYIVQYNTLGKSYAEPGPYEFKISRERVTEEDAKVKLLNPSHLLLNFPNSITEKDFEGWIQERGLYFPDEWDDKYEPILEMNDLGESPKQGSLLYAEYGEGVFIYTGLSFFRELPAGVPGAYNLFINLISAGKNIE